jgi:hypothetical protein
MSGQATLEGNSKVSNSYFLYGQYLEYSLCYLLKLFQEWGERGIKENNGGGEFMYDIFDTL